MSRRPARQFARWPLVLAVLTGAVLLLERWAGLPVEDWVLALTQMVFAVALAGIVLGGFMAFIVWWFFSRHPR
ncbi:hypothetical protein [Salsipaludibacter albus]|uniref:hypothetical protein n=1 Tax=Salsipaludibacter albus TaxID=2849650 RepID=UPI001EE4C60D|nr:hypothetical protein [Salsipaludibacter albus]MBY5163305.1 hypothetical protein [Salsipaludibacter albus]